jgi:hypothetical protein
VIDMALSRKSDKKHAKYDIVAAHEEATKTMLRNALEEKDRTGSLGLTGVEVLIFLAAKVVVPIVCSFISSVLFNKYKDAETKRELATARTEIAKHEGPLTPQVDRAVVIDSIVAGLLREGVPREVATGVVERTLDDIGKELSKKELSEKELPEKNKPAAQR